MFRRDIKLFWRCLCSAFLMAVILSALGAAAVTVLTGSGDGLYDPVKVAVVDKENSLTSRILLHAVGGSDFINGLLEIETMGEDEALSALYSGGVSAAVLLPEGYIENILRGAESKGRIIISSELSSQRSIVESIAKMGEILLVSGQNGVFSGEALLSEHDISREMRSMYYERVNSALLREAMTAKDRYFTIEELSYCDTGMSETQYTAACWITVLMLLVSVAFIPLFKTDCTTPLLQRMYVSGIGDIRFLMHKLTLTFLFRMMIMSVTTAVLVCSDIMLPDASSVLYIVLSAMFVTVAGAALTLSFGNAIASSVIAAVGGLLLCGGIVPRQLMPRIVTVIGDCTPFGAAKALIAPAFGAAPDVTSFIIAFAYTAVFCALLHVKLSRMRAGGGRDEA